MWKEYSVKLPKDVMLKYLFPKTMVFLTEQQFLWEDLSFGGTFYVADIFQQNKIQKFWEMKIWANFFSWQAVLRRQHSSWVLFKEIKDHSLQNNFYSIRMKTGRGRALKRQTKRTELGSKIWKKEVAQHMSGRILMDRKVISVNK